VAFLFSDQGPRTTADTDCGDGRDILRELGWTGGDTVWGTSGDPLRRAIVAKYGFADGPLSDGQGGAVVANIFVGIQTDTFSGTDKPQYMTRAPVWVNAERTRWVYLYAMYMHGGYYTPDTASDIHADIRNSLALIGGHVAHPRDGMPAQPSVFGGDLNFTTDGWDAQCANRVVGADTLLGMTDTWRFVYPGSSDAHYEGFTKGCGEKGISPRLKRIDYIFSTGLAIDSAAIVDRSGCDISDHKGVVTRFALD
jgi:endonuclease/exonuclease/phosphatase family metal-dependent hydrolase